MYGHSLAMLVSVAPASGSHQKTNIGEQQVISHLGGFVLSHQVEVLAAAAESALPLLVDRITDRRTDTWPARERNEETECSAGDAVSRQESPAG